MGFFFEKETSNHSCKYCGNQTDHGPYHDICGDCMKKAIEVILELHQLVGSSYDVNDTILTLHLLKQEIGSAQYKELFKLLATIKTGDNFGLLKELVKRS